MKPGYLIGGSAALVLGVAMIVLGIYVRKEAGKDDDLLLKVDSKATSKTEKTVGLVLIVVGSVLSLAGVSLIALPFVLGKRDSGMVEGGRDTELDRCVQEKMIDGADKLEATLECSDFEPRSFD